MTSADSQTGAPGPTASPTPGPIPGATKLSAGREGLQRIDVKLLLDAPPGLETDFLLSIFGRWRLEEGEEIVDLADYAHVDDGPSCLLISHLWHFGISFSGGRPGLFYSSRKGLAGTDEERIAGALRGLVAKGRRLIAEPEFPPDARPASREIEIVFNDRLLAPNDAAGDARLRPAVEAIARRVHGAGACTPERDPEPKRRLGYRILARADGPDLEAMARKLG